MTEDLPPRDVARLRLTARLVLGLVATAGAVLSYDSLYRAAVPTFGRVLAGGFPLLVDALVLGASLQYVAGARVGRPRAGWRLTAHAAVAGTVILNAMAAPDLTRVPWHVTAPLVWSVLVELTGRDVLGEWRAEHAVRDRIPARLWVTAPVESVRTSLRAARTGAVSATQARADMGLHSAAVEALRLAIPGRSGRRVRRILVRQLRAGSLPPAAVLAPLGWTGDVEVTRTPELVLRASLAAVLTPPAPRPPRARPADVERPTVLPDVPTVLGTVEAPPSAPAASPGPIPAASVPAGMAPARTIPALSAKAAVALAALDEVNGSVAAAYALLVARGTPVGKTTLFEVAKTRPASLRSPESGAESTGAESTGAESTGAESGAESTGAESGAESTGPEPDRVVDLNGHGRARRLVVMPRQV